MAKSFVWWACVLSGVAMAAGCGQSPAGSTGGDSPSRELRVVSGDTGEPVPAASVKTDGATYLTDGRGMALVAADGELEIASDAFLPRRTRAGEGTISMWPRSSAYSESYVRALVYQRAYLTRETATGAEEPLRRLTASTVAVVPDAALWSDPEVLAAHERAAAEMTAACQGRVRFLVRQGAGADPGIRTFLDPAMPAGSALAYRELRGDAILGGRISYASLAIARDVRFVAHELGHVLGLEHSLVRSDLMYYAIHADSPEAFSANERLSLRLLLQRQPGNRFPDTDPLPGSRSVARRGETIVD